MLTKRKKMVKLVVMFCIAGLSAFAGIAQADGGGLGGEHCGKQQHHNFKRIEKKLGLTDAQKAQAKTLFEANKSVVKPILTNLRAEENNLHTLMHAVPVDETAIRAETVKIAGIQADLNINRANVAAQFRALLTPAQQATLKTLHQKCPEKDCAITAPTE